MRAVCWDREHPEDPGKWSEKPVQWEGISHSAQPYYYSFVANNQVAYLRVADMKPRESYELMKGYKVAGLKEMLEQYYKEQKQEIPADLDDAIRGVNSLTKPATEMLEQMKRQDTKSLIIDLRGNSGGTTAVIVPFLYEMYGDNYFGRNDDAEFVKVKSEL